MTVGHVDPDGIRHEVTVRSAASDDWQVLDTSAAETRIVEALDGRVDDRDRAKAVARDYAENVRRLGWIPGQAPAERIPEREAVSRAPGQSHVPRGQIDAVLRHGVFGPGATGLVSEEIEPGVAIRVDETRDRQLARLFEWRAGLDDEQFAAQWETNPARHAHVLVCPHAPEATYAYQVRVLRPVKLTRTLLLLVSKHARILSLLLEPGAVIWLVPQAIAMREWASEGVGTADDLLAHALPVGQVKTPPRGLEQALGHFGYSDA